VQTLKPWLVAVIDPVLFLIGLYLVLPEWGLPREQMSRLIAEFLAGFSIGGVTISIADIAVAAIVFAAVLLITRSLRRLLSERILPQTRLDLGVRNSIVVGIGYVGVLLAVLLTFGVLGLGLSNVAIVAGALSVGIGFGLQNIVNNFVSGLILLVERPLKVGDWVVIGDKQGYVKRINVRATEIETFERASLIVPNSEVLSSALLNWTHKDKLGRVDIRVGVAYGTEPRKVRDILIQCAEGNGEVMRWPRPFVAFLDFGPSALDFILYAYVRDVEKRGSVASDLRFAIDDAFRREQIEIPFAHQVVHVPELDALGRALSVRGGGAGSEQTKTDHLSVAETAPSRTTTVPPPTPPAVPQRVSAADTQPIAGAEAAANVTGRLRVTRPPGEDA
jgi:small-conductance mechanosensitive channel